MINNDLSARRTTVAAAAAAAAAAVATAAVLAPASAGAESNELAPEPSGGAHCVLEVTGQHKSGEYLLAEPVCFGTLAEALAEVGADVDPGDHSLSMRDVVRGDLLAASATLATHYDGFNRTGASVIVAGSTCSGGYVNLPSGWINRISSTLNSCPSVYFFDGYDKTGQSESAAYNLSALNNRANSVMYA